MDKLDGKGILKKLETAGRVCYKSEDRIGEGTAEKFVKAIIDRGHESVLEHGEYILQFKNPNDYSKIICGMRAIEEETGDKSLLRHTVNKERYIISGNVRMWRDFIKNCIKNNIYICKKALTLLTYVFDITSKIEFKILFGDLLTVPDKYTVSPYPVTFLIADDLITDAEILTHKTITAKFVTDRGISHEIVRHRIASYSQESTRYCNYSKEGFGGSVTFVQPSFAVEGTEGFDRWKKSCEESEKAYFDLLNFGWKPEQARNVLSHSIKTEVVVTMNIRQWRHFIKLRTDKTAHPQIREVATMLQEQLRREVPIIFD